MTRTLRRLLYLIACVAVLLATATPASGADDSPVGEEPGCVYIAEDWNGYEFTYYCPKGSKNELQHYFNSHAAYYVNWSKKSDNSIGYWRIVDGRPERCPDDADRGTCHAAGQPCRRGMEHRTDCLNDHDYTGVGEWMRGQDDPGILNNPDKPHLLKNIRDNPCDVLQAPDPSGDHPDQYRLRAKCPDIRSGTNPCDRISDGGWKSKCKEAHPWFDWEPPDGIDPEDIGCVYSSAAPNKGCAGTQLVGSDKVGVPRGVVEPLRDIGDLFIVIVFLAGCVGLFGHVWQGVEAYRSGDAVAEFFGRTMWSLTACAGATSVSAVVWMVFNA